MGWKLCGDKKERGLVPCRDRFPGAGGAGGEGRGGGDDVPEEEKGLARRNINISYIAYKHTTGMRINLRFTVILSQIKPPRERSTS